MEKLPIFISISTPPYKEQVEKTITTLYQVIDQYQINGIGFLRNTLGVTELSHLKGFIRISKVIKKSFGGIVMGFPRDYSTLEGEVIAKPTLWNHIEGSMIYLSEKPMLIIQDINIESNNGVFDVKNFSEDKIKSGLIHYLTIDFEDVSALQNPNSLPRKELEVFLKKVYTNYMKNFNKVPIYISIPSEKKRNSFQEELFQYISKFLADKDVIFTNTNQYGFDPIRNSIKKSCGAIIFGFTQKKIPEFIFRKGVKKREKIMQNLNNPSIWNDIEGAMAYQEGFPLLILKEKTLYRYYNTEKEEENFYNGIFDEFNHQYRIIKLDLENIDYTIVDMYIEEWLESVREYLILTFFDRK